MQCWKLRNDAVELAVTAEGGHFDDVIFHTPMRAVRPLHTAPWTDEADLTPDTPTVLRLLRGDFFCAPFGDSDDLEPGSTWIHGASANAAWQALAHSETQLTAVLTRPIAGAELTKRIHLLPGHTVIYQEHTFVGGRGPLPIGHHAMLRAPEPLRVSLSPRIWGGTAPKPLEADPGRGVSLLKYPQEISDLATVRLADGAIADLREYPALPAHEDLVLFAADPAAALKWSAAVAPEEGWVWFDLSDPRTLASTVLWMSQGGRRYAPWNGRHRNVLGIEQVTANFNLGYRASCDLNPLAQRGIATHVTLSPDEPLVVRYLFGVAPVPFGFGRVRDISAVPGGVRIEDTGGNAVRIACDTRFITGAA
ncbi:MAG: hypothetical protein IPM18_17605 [Phycisphaerales bacterium]|nr:hypothetical protein [Phycisphaerales bacterium]